MNISKRQLRRIIREEKRALGFGAGKLISERGSGNPALRMEERALMNAVVTFADAYMLTMSMNPGDPADAKRTRHTIDDIIDAVMGGILG
mgnify:CR=1 FL=1